MDDLNDFANEVGRLRNQLFLKQAKRASDRVDQELQVIENEDVAKSLLALNENALDSLPPADGEAVPNALQMEKIVVGSQEMEKINWDVPEWPTAQNDLVEQPPMK